MPTKLTINPSAKGAGSPTPVPPPIIPTMSTQSGTSSGSTMSSQTPAPSSSSSTSTSTPHPSRPPPKKVIARKSSQPPVLPPLTKMTHTTSNARQPNPLPASATTHQQPLADDDDEDDDDDDENDDAYDDEDDFPAPPYSPITPPSSNTPPPMPENSETVAPCPTMSAPPKTVTHIPPPVIPPNFASMAGRVPLTHNSHPPVVATASQPLPEPIDFNNNTDVIAIQATMAILLQQKKKAEADIRQLNDAKNAAMEHPMEFYKDLVGDRMSQGQKPLKTEEDEEEDDSDDDGDVEMKMEDGATTGNDDLKPSAMGAKASKKRKGQVKSKGKGKATASASNGSNKAPSAVPAARPWANLPKQQDVVRMPPVNWAQYAVEGEAFDRLHNTQLTHPVRGTPAVIRADGTHEFTGVANPDDGKKVEGISAPFNPLRDIVEDKKRPAKGGAASRRGL